MCLCLMPGCYAMSTCHTNVVYSNYGMEDFASKVFISNCPKSFKLLTKVQKRRKRIGI